MGIKKFDEMEEEVPMVFKNRPNVAHKTESGEEVWDSRSVAVTGVIFAWKDSDDYPYVLISKRGPAAADFSGKMNCVCGYLDKGESGTEAFIREAWEEVGINLVKIMNSDREMIEHMDQPWYVNHYPTENRENVTLRFGICFAMDDNEKLPKLTTIHNEKIGEVEDPQWISFEDIDNFEWAFGHDEVIKKYFDIILNTHN
jgi:8-oxo-dGTP pyrophosphatase MutT (NUDIX family)